MEHQSFAMCRECYQPQACAREAHQQSSSKNTIRTTLAEIMAIQPATSKPVINLGLGDPTTLHTPPPASVTAVVETLQAGRDNGYIPGPGTIAAREAIGRYHKRWDGVDYGVNDITLVGNLQTPRSQSSRQTHGVGHALDTIFNILVTPHPVDSFDHRPRCNVLIPRPGFAQYGMLLNSLGAEIRFYSLKEEQNWEVDVEELNMLCDENTRAILLVSGLTDFSNPALTSDQPQQPLRQQLLQEPPPRHPRRCRQAQDPHHL